MGMVHHLQRFHIPFDVEAFIATHKNCPNEPEILQELWKSVSPFVFWRDAIITGNTGERLVLENGACVIDSCYVCKGLQQSKRATMMALSIGSALPKEAQQCAAEGKLYRSAIADYLGSYAVELFADAFCQFLQQQALPRGLYATLRYSPGYGDWNLAGQTDVFSFLKDCQHQIVLSENYLMEPIKSITALIGWANQWQKPKYPVGERNSFCNGGHNCAACITWACRKGKSKK